MPVTFEGVSEYHRNFVVPQAISDHTHSPPAPVPTSPVAKVSQPHPQQGHNMIIAGLSSAKMAVTQEPAFARKRKPMDHGKKVTFTTDYSEHGSPTTKEDNKAMKFRAGFRRIDVPTPTEYNLQYTWKNPALDHTPSLQDRTPLLQAENLLDRQTRPSDYSTNQQQPHHNGHLQNRGIRDDDENNQDDENFEQQELYDNLPQGDTVDGVDGVSRLSSQKDGIKVPKLQLASDTDSPKGGKSKHAHSSSKAAAKKKPKSHHCHQSHHHTSKKHKGGYSKAFMSEYKRQYKAWSIPSSSSGTKASGKDGHGKKKNGIVAGSPQVLTDSSDPRLLKHKPLPTHIPIARWGSEYSANFMSPTEFDYERGVWKGAPHPELYMKAEGKPVGPSVAGHPSQPQQSDSWFNQLVELRQKADEYRARSERVHFPPYDLSGHLRDSDSNSSVTTPSTTSPSEDQIESEMSSPTSDSAGDVRVRVHGDFDDQSVPSRQNQGPVGAGGPRVRGKKPPQQAQLFTKATAPSAKGVSGKGAHMGDGYHQMKVEDVEEDWDSETLTEDSSSPQDSGKLYSSTPPKAQDYLKTHDVGTELSKLQEPTVNEGRSKSIPRPNAFSIGDGEIEGRVPTPELRKSIPGQQSRHHLDITTPSCGGVLISPTKPEVGRDRGVAKPVDLPYPPVSPKYRRDMRSKAPIYPPPPPEIGNGRQDGDAPIIGSTSNEVPHRLVSDSLGPQSVPAPSGSPYHAHCVPHPPNIPLSKPTHNLTHSSHPHPPHVYKSQPAHKPASTTSVHVAQPKGSVKPQTSYSGPVRKFLFESHGKQPPSQHHHTHVQHVTKKPVSSSSSQYRSHTKVSASSAAKVSHSNIKSCETCGSYLRSSAVLGGGVSTLGAGHSRRAPPTNLSQLHSDKASTLQASRQQSQLKINEIRSKLASHSTDSHHHHIRAPANLDDNHRPDSGLGSSNRERDGGQRLNGLSGRRARDVDELSLSSLSLSSCSVASDVLQKARERRERFWMQPPHITAS